VGLAQGHADRALRVWIDRQDAEDAKVVCRDL
jgi:hypothetical protein